MVRLERLFKVLLLTSASLSILTVVFLSVSRPTDRVDLQNQTFCHSHAATPTYTSIMPYPLGLQDAKGCKPKTYIYFLKVHKAASTTMENIFSRYSYVNNLTIAFGTTNKSRPPDTFLGWPFPFSRGYIKPLPPTGIHIIHLHTRFNYSGVKEVMPPGTKYIAVLRDPVAQFESYYRYFNFERRLNVSIINFLKHPLTASKSMMGLRLPLRNTQLFDAGASPGGDSYEHLMKIAELDRIFDLIVIDKYFDESLILLKELLCWDMDDVVVFKRNAGGHRSKVVTPVMAKGMHDWNFGDVMLYNHFKTKLEKTIQSYGPKKMEAQVAKLNERREYYFRKCVYVKKMHMRSDKNVFECTSIGASDKFDCMLKKEAKNDTLCLTLFGGGLKLLKYLRLAQHGF